MWRPCGFLQSATPVTHLVETLPSLFRFQFPNGVNIFLGIMVRQVVNLICIVTFTVHVVFPKEPVKSGTIMRGLVVSVPRCFVSGSTAVPLIHMFVDKGST